MPFWSTDFIPEIYDHVTYSPRIRNFGPYWNFSNIQFWSSSNTYDRRISMWTKTAYPKRISHVIINFGNKVSGPKLRRHVYGVTWLPPLWTENLTLVYVIYTQKSHFRIYWNKKGLTIEIYQSWNICWMICTQHQHSLNFSTSILVNWI